MPMLRALLALSGLCRFILTTLLSFGSLTSSLYATVAVLSDERAVSKQRLSYWLLDAIALAYAIQGQDCPFNVRAHSMSAVASSWAWSKGTSIRDICFAPGWSSQNASGHNVIPLKAVLCVYCYVYMALSCLLLLYLPCVQCSCSFILIRYANMVHLS